MQCCIILLKPLFLQWQVSSEAELLQVMKKWHDNSLLVLVLMNYHMCHVHPQQNNEQMMSWPKMVYYTVTLSLKQRCTINSPSCPWPCYLLLYVSTQHDVVFTIISDTKHKVFIYADFSRVHENKDWWLKQFSCISEILCRQTDGKSYNYALTWQTPISCQNALWTVLPTFSIHYFGSHHSMLLIYMEYCESVLKQDYN